MASHNELGKWGEETATIYLRQKGYTILERDWKSGHRDIDIIATINNTIVFIEVKTRKFNSLTSPIEAVNYQKLKNLKTAHPINPVDEEENSRMPYFLQKQIKPLQ